MYILSALSSRDVKQRLPSRRIRPKMLGIFLLAVLLPVPIVSSQDGSSITTCCDGYQAPGAVHNGTCRQVTYHVQQMYQACPPKGTVIEVDKPETSPSTRLRLSVVEGKLVTLENLYKDVVGRLAATPSAPGHKDVPREAVHNVTKVGGAYPVDCTELFSLGYRCTGVFLIKPAGSPQPFPTFCELAYDGWTIITRRFDGSVDFYRKWADYKNGFGSVAGEHWLGNDRINLLTNQKNYQLRVEFTRWSDNLRYYADYSRFKIESEGSNYKLHIMGYSGNSGYDGLTSHDKMVFSTWDRDNDPISSRHCAQEYKSAFWYNSRCHDHGVATGLYKQDCGTVDCTSWDRTKALKQLLWKVKSI